MIKNIIKRDGRNREFDPQKITNAILAAMKQCNVWDLVTAAKITNKIAKLKMETIEIEKIQDMIEVELMKTKYKKVAKEFITYRDKRSKARQRNNKLNKEIENICLGNNVQNSNANVDENSFAGRKNESANALHKNLALNVFIRPEVADAHIKHRLYIHDLSEYNVGSPNCLFINMSKLLTNGFSTRNGGVRPANSFNTACQLFAVIFQIQSQSQFGGVASAHIDFDLAPYVKKSFLKHYKNGLEFVDTRKDKTYEDFYAEASRLYFGRKDWLYELSIEDEIYMSYSLRSYKYATAMLEKEGLQAAQALYHNLNTLESRPGSQLPFTSINFGRDISPEGRKVTEWLLKASIAGIGINNETPIFPISIFQYKKGINDKPGTPNYDLKLLAIESLSKRIYPNIVNGDWSENVDTEDDPDTFMATMGCRTLIGKDRHGAGYNKVGRGNACPVTINLPKIGIKNGICLGERDKPDIDGFFKELIEVLKLTETALVDRFYYMCKQSVKAASFVYKNGTVVDSKKARAKGIYQTLRHFSLGIGFIGLAETCKAMFGMDHSYGDKEVNEFADCVVSTIAKYASDCSDRNDLNFACYATPAESVCKTLCVALQKEFGDIKDVTDRGYLTNSHHVPVWRKISIADKLQIESKFCSYSKSGCITYVELEAKVMTNPKAIEDIIDYAMGLNIPYTACNFPIDTCVKCGYQGEIEISCPKCGSNEVNRLRRVTGYLTADYRQFNEGKIKECLDRVKHSSYTDMTVEDQLNIHISTILGSDK